MSNAPPTLEKPGVGLEENDPRGNERRTATSEPRKISSRGQRNTGLTDKGREASIQAWDDFGKRCERKGKAKR